MMFPKGYRNHEEQDYRPSQVRVADGALRITASRDANGEWHSGEVHSKWRYTYGEFEVRMAVSPVGPGVWPAAWLMGTTDNWPANGEIDILENINGSPTAYGTIHGGGLNGHWQLQRQYSGVDVTGYHTYKVVKGPGAMSWWVDGVKRGEWQQSEAPAGAVWPFESHQNFALLNLAIGGDWPGPSTAATPGTVVMSVDYFTVKNGR
jgi:beta-glucanase (GH16 family)